MKGISLSIFESEVDSFLDRFLLPRIDSRIHLRFLQAKKRGEKTFLLSSAPAFLVSKIAARLGFDLWQGTEYCIDKEGRLCEISTLIDGEAKLACAKSHADGEAIVYSDSHDDLPLFEWAARAVVVRPRRRLRKIAEERTWEIL